MMKLALPLRSLSGQGIVTETEVNGKQMSDQEIASVHSQESSDGTEEHGLEEAKVHKPTTFIQLICNNDKLPG